jgi:cytochrome c-type biogenesis protein CcmH/NrfG
MMLPCIFIVLTAATVACLLWPLLRRTNGDDISIRGKRLRMVVILAIAVLLPLGAWLLYSDLGAPELPGQPYAARIKDDPDFAPVVNAEEEFNRGLKEAQAGNLRRAVAIWKDLQKHSAPDAPWAATVANYIKAAATQGDFNPKSIAPESAP